MPDLKIYLLGPFQILVDGVPVEEARWTRKKAKVLVKVLALARHHKMHRGQLADLLWPEMEADAALNNLHKIIHAARRVLDPEFVVTQESVVSLAEANVWIDADEFEQRAGEALKTGWTESLEAALSLYQGDILEEDLYEDWASLRREQLRLLQQRVLERLAEVREAEGDERAIELWNRVLATNRAHEEAHRRLMRIYAATGRRHLALVQYRLCTEALQQDLEAGPERATVELYEGLLTGGVAAEQPPGVSAGPVEAAPEKPRMSGRAVRRAAAAIAVVSLAIAAYFLIPKRRANTGSPPSLAILPLRVNGEHADLENAGDGITEELINSISRFPGIRVMARGTVFAYKGRSDVREVGRELKVKAVLSGYLREDATSATIGVELIDVADGGAIVGAEVFHAGAEFAVDATALEFRSRRCRAGQADR